MREYWPAHRDWYNNDLRQMIDLQVPEPGPVLQPEPEPGPQPLVPERPILADRETQTCWDETVENSDHR